MVAHISISHIARALGVARDTANDAVLAEGEQLLIDKPGRLDNVTVVGTDEHVWRHTWRGDRYVTIGHRSDPRARRDRAPGYWTWSQGVSKAVLKTWLAARPKVWRDAIETVAMDGSAGSKPPPP